MIRPVGSAKQRPPAMGLRFADSKSDYRCLRLPPWGVPSAGVPLLQQGVPPAGEPNALPSGEPGVQQTDDPDVEVRINKGYSCRHQSPLSSPNCTRPSSPSPMTSSNST